MNKKKLMSMIVIALIVSIPIYSASVMASFIEITSMHGEDNVEGFLGDVNTGSLTVVVQAAVDNDADLSTSQVRYEGTGPNPLYSSGSPGASFDTCINMGSYFECIFTRSDISSFASKESVEVYLYDDSDLRVGADSEDLYVDSLAPLIEKFDLSPDVVSSGNVTFDLKVKEQLCTNAQICNNKCSDMDRIEISAGSYNKVINFGVVDVVNTTNSTNSTSASLVNCVYNSTFDVSLLGIEPGASSQILSTISAIITAYDVFGQSSSQMASFDIDTTIPSINNLEITAGGSLVTDVSNSSIAVEVSVVVSGDNLDVDSVYADLHELNVNAPSSYYGMAASCSSTGTDAYTCRWSIDLLLNSSAAPSIRINASDTNGNIGYATLTASSIDYDATGPNVNSITTNYQSLGDYYLGLENNKIEVELTEEGIGLYDGNIILDLSSVGASQMSPDSCNVTSNSLWTCYYSDVVASNEGVQEISVVSTSADDLGNKIVGSVNQNVTVDLTFPSYVSHNIDNLASDAIDGIIKTGDSLYIKMNISEANQIVNAYADFSAIIDGANAVAPDDGCTNESNIWSCTWTTTPIDISGEINDDLKFYFIDAANNTLEHNVNMSIYGILNATSPNYWGNSVSCSPSGLDREIVPIFSLRSYCHVYLSALDSSDDLETLSIDLDNCVADNSSAASIGYISGAELLNDARGSDEPYIKLSFTQSDAKIDEIKINCPLKIKSRVGQSITEQEEEEIVAITIGLYNNPLGEISDNTKDKIDDIIDDVDEGFWEIVGMLSEILDYAEMGCNLWSHLSNLGYMLEGLTEVLGLGEEGMSWNPVGKNAIMAARKGTCKVGDTIQEAAKDGYEGGLNQLCNFVNCKMGRAANPDEKDKEIRKWGTAFGGGGTITGIQLTDFYGSIETNKHGQITATDGFAASYTGKEPNEYIDVKESIVWSVLTLCIPGIIYNLDKWRQIKCIKGACYLSIMDTPGTTDSDTESIPLAMCDEREDYLICKYVIGELFRIAPFVNLYTHYVDMIHNALRDPLSLAGFALFGTWCQPECDSEGYHYPHWSCATAKILSMFGAAIADVMNYIDNDWQLQDDYCHIFEEMQGTFGYTKDSDTSTTSGSSTSSNLTSTSTGSSTTTSRNVTNSSST